MPVPAHGPSLEGCFPDLAAVSSCCDVIGDGWDSLVMRLDGRWAVRIPRGQQVAEALRVEARLLPALAQRLPVAVPVPEFLCPTHASMAYRWLPGRPADDVPLDRGGTLAVQLADLLTALWRFPVAGAESLGVRASGVRPVIERLKEYLHGQQALLILDNFEHVLPAAPAVTELLAGGTPRASEPG